MRLLGTAFTVFLLLGFAVAASKGTRLFLWFWIPFFLLSILGTGVGVYSLTFLFSLSGQAGEAAGFAGAGAFLLMMCSVPYLIGLIVALRVRSK